MARSSDNHSAHRLKRSDLAMKIFYLFSEEHEHSDKESIWDLELPMETVRQYLATEHGVSYRSNQWIYTQLRRYEQEVGVSLFRKIPDGSGDSFRLALHAPMPRFYQKRHLYVTQRIKVANGAYDKILHEVGARGLDRPVRTLLGAGSTVFHLANILAEKSWQDPTRYAIYTHNVGSLQSLLNHRVNYDRISVCVLNGTIDPITYTIVGPDASAFTSVDLDFVVQGTSVIHDGLLYVESEEEFKVKSAILHECSGTKILVLTKHEFRSEPLAGASPFGSLTDYDYVVVPRSSAGEDRPRKRYDEEYESYQSRFEPEIMNWNYTILKVVK